jgi:hypothetical protein
MSRITELQIAQYGYEAGKMAIEKTRPEILGIDISYEIADLKLPEGKRTVYPGKVFYKPGDDLFIIRGHRPDMGCEGEIGFTPDAIPALIKVLKELTE